MVQQAKNTLILSNWRSNFDYDKMNDMIASIEQKMKVFT